MIAEVQHSAGIEETSLLNLVVSDGHTLIATRCVFPEAAPAASLYYSEGSSFQRSTQVSGLRPFSPRASSAIFSWLLQVGSGKRHPRAGRLGR